MIVEATKACTVCGDEKPVTAFYAKRAQCKACRSEYMGRYWRGTRSHGCTIGPHKTQAWRTGKARWLVEQHGGDHMAAAGEAFRRAEQWQQDGNRGVFGDASADDVVGTVAADWREAVKLLSQVVRMAKEQGER